MAKFKVGDAVKVVLRSERNTLYPIPPKTEVLSLTRYGAYVSVENNKRVFVFTDELRSPK